MRFTKRTYKLAYRLYMDAGTAAWMGYAESKDEIDYEAFKILYRKADKIVRRAGRELNMWDTAVKYEQKALR